MSCSGNSVGVEAVERRTGGAAKSMGADQQSDCVYESGADRPPTGFPWFTFGLPRPPSVNRFVKRLGNASPGVREWHNSCDRYLMTYRPRPRLRGPFEVRIVWDIDQFGRFDGDNRVKPLMDYLQRAEFIENDKWCRRYVIEWGPASLGCMVSLRQWSAA